VYFDRRLPNLEDAANVPHMKTNFDAYYHWLGIPPKDQPSNHYRMLGIELFEDNQDVISVEADRQMVHLRTFQAGPRVDQSQKLLNEVARACGCLLDQQQKAVYDAFLTESQGL